jgi:hypothetical protein
MLDYPNRLGLRQQAEIAAARTETIQDGDLLHLWVRSPEDIEQD